jgi:hypothetical protein
MHMSVEIFKSMAGIDLVHIPYKGGGPAQLGIAIGEAYMGISTTGSMLSMVQARRIRALAVGRAARLTDHPDLPTFAEAGMPGYDTNTWYSVHAPAGTPDAIADKLNKELVHILGLADIKERLRQLSSDGVGLYTRADRCLRQARVGEVRQGDQGRRHQGRIAREHALGNSDQIRERNGHAKSRHARRTRMGGHGSADHKAR